MTKTRLFLPLLIAFTILTGCTVTYKFNGASIDYNRIKTIAIADFSNQATLVYPPMAKEFTDALKDMYATQTRLRILPRDGQLNLEGEIVGYELTPMAAQADGYAAETKLTVTINVRYTNTDNPDENFEEKFTAYRTFPATKMLEDVQESIVQEIDKEITEQIFNKTVANW